MGEAEGEAVDGDGGGAFGEGGGWIGTTVAGWES